MKRGVSAAIWIAIFVILIIASVVGWYAYISGISRKGNYWELKLDRYEATHVLQDTVRLWIKNQGTYNITINQVFYDDENYSWRMWVDYDFDGKYETPTNVLPVGHLCEINITVPWTPGKHYITLWTDAGEFRWAIFL